MLSRLLAVRIRPRLSFALAPALEHSLEDRMNSCRLSTVALLSCYALTAVVAQGDEPNADLSEEEAASEGEAQHWFYVHGILMTLGWVALLPLGALIAQNRRWQSMKSHVARKEVWFWLHVLLQVIGTALIIAAFGIAYSDSTHMEPEREETLAYTHKVIGTIAFAFLLLQVVGAIIRPHPGARGRGIWNHIHHNTGRLAIILAWVNIWLGVAVWNEDGSIRNGLAAWVAPLVVFQALLLIAYIVGAFMKPKTPTTSDKPVVNDESGVANPPAGPVRAAQV